MQCAPLILGWQRQIARDDDAKDAIGIAQIDYAFALSLEWCGVVRPPAEPRSAFPDGVGFDRAACDEITDDIEKLEEPRISEIVNRVPVEYFSAIPDAKSVILSELLRRRDALREWLK